MKTQGGTFENLGLHASRALSRLVDWLGGDGIIDLIETLGLSLPDGAGAELRSAATALVDAAATLQTPAQALIAALESDPVDPVETAGAAADVFSAIDNVLAAIEPLRDAIEELDGVPPTVLRDFAGQLARRLVDFVAITHIELEWPFLLRVLVALGIVELEQVEANDDFHRPRHVRRSINLERLKLLLEPSLNPAETLYRWGHNDLRAEQLLEILSRIALSVGLPAFYSKPDDGEGRVDLGPLQLIHRPDLDPSGFAAQLDPSALSPGPYQFNLSPSLEAELRFETTIDQPPAILVEPGHPPHLQNLGALGEGRALARVTAASDSPDGRLLLFGQPKGTRFEADSLAWTGELRIEPTDQGVLLEPSLLAQVEGGSISIDLGEADSFLAGLLAEEPRVDFDFGLAWDRQRGLHLSQGVGLSIVVPIQKELGPILLDTLHVEVAAVDTGLQIDLSTTLGGRIGPVAFTVDRVGARVDFLTGDDAKPLRIQFGFKPPSGIALTVDGGAIGGGGFLQFDPNRAEYSGAMQLEAAGVRLSAIGLLTTRLPDGADGFSLLVILSAEFSPGFQLGYGFVLTKVGGLLGLQRSVQEETLREGLQSGTLGSILFPEDPTRNASQILRDLGPVFPPTMGRHVLGPVVEIGWGQPRPIVKMQLAVLLELPAPVRVALLGRIQMFLPDAAVPLARINMDALGTLDPHQGQISIDATLFDSTLTIYALTGDMAMRVRYGDHPQFALAIGGFHPAFQPPPGFPALERVAITLSSGNNPRIRLEAYLALTSNTLQMGARLDIYASAAGFSISGSLGFDGLFQFSPFQFLVEVNGRVTLKRGSQNLMSLTLKLTLSGITPWRARGSVHFQILLFKGSIQFDRTFGGGSQPVIPTLAVWPLLQDALQSAGNWSAELPGSSARLVSLAPPADSPDKVLVHPLATPTVRQKVIPLAIQLDRVGQARPIDGDRFELAPQVTLGGAGTSRAVEAKPVRDYFAAALFQDLSDSERLSRPSFEPMQAGVAVGGGAISLGAATSRAVAYEEILIDAKRRRAFPISHLGTSIGLSKEELRAGAGVAAAARAVRGPGGLKFGADSIRVELRDPEYALTDMASLPGTGIQPAFQTSHSAFGVRRNRVRRQVVERSEIATGRLDLFNHE